MRVGIIGLPGSGKSTVFQTLTHTKPEQWAPKGPLISTVQVRDDRVDGLTKLMKPKKTVYAHMEYLLPRSGTPYGHDKKGDEGPWSEIRPCDALVHVVRNFHIPGGEPPHPRQDLNKLEGEMIFADLVVAERRIERMNLDRKRGRDINEAEQTLLEACLKILEEEKPLRDHAELASPPLLKGYAFLSAKPVLIVFNNDEEDTDVPPWSEPPAFPHTVAVRGKLEKELAELSSEEAQEFLAAYNVESPSSERIVRYSCQALGLISFFTVANREVRSWLIPTGTKAIEAAGAIHSDMKKGFIRAEILAYDNLVAAGTYQQAKKAANMHLEGKDYVVEDGDVIYFRFNV